MNKVRRKNLANIIERLQELQAVLEELAQEEEEYRDNMPENLWESERFSVSEEASENMDYAISAFDEAIGYIESAIGE